MNEVWKSTPPPNYQDSYEVSNLGRVRSKNRKVYAGRGGYRLAKAKYCRQENIIPDICM